MLSGQVRRIRKFVKKFSLFSFRFTEPVKVPPNNALIACFIPLFKYLFLAVGCGMPEEGFNTAAVPADTSLKFGDEYMYTCLCGFEPALSGQEMVTECTEDGSFSLQPPPNCTGRYWKIKCDNFSNESALVYLMAEDFQQLRYYSYYDLNNC